MFAKKAIRADGDNEVVGGKTSYLHNMLVDFG